MIAKGGNLTSLKFDAIDGAINSLPGVSISFVIVFSQAKWSGAETKDAALMAGKAGLRTLAMGTSIYVASQQFAKIFTKQINDYFGKKVTAEVVARRVAPVISFAVIMAPDIFEALVGRISSQQLLKNAAVAGGGMMAGAIIGSIAGGFGVKLIADQFIEDDRVEMFAQLKEEFIDVVMVISLSQKEFNKIQEDVFNEQLEGLLKDMFQRKENSRTYAKEFVEEKVKSVIKDRKRVELKEIIEAVQVINDVQDSSESGLKQNDGAWYYLNNSGSLAKGWIQDNEHWYYLSEDGALVTGWFKYNDVWYYLKDNGAMAIGWIQDSGKWYYLKPSGDMATGWQEINGKVYYLKPSGDRATGWEKIDGKWYYFNTNGNKESGWIKPDNNWYYLDSSGIMQTGFITLYGTTYYLHPSGAMATGWQEIQGETYYFNNSGAQQNIDRRAIVLGETSTKAVPMGDVNAMGNTFNNTRLNGKAFSSVSVYPNHTKQEILSKFRYMFSNSKDSDINYIYMTCHGDQYGNIFIGSDDTYFSGRELKNILSQYRGKFVVMIDCCYSGTILSKSSATNPAKLFVDNFTNSGNYSKSGELRSDKFLVLCASSQTESSFSTERISYATKYWAKGAGWDGVYNSITYLQADYDSNKKVTLSELYNYSKERVNYDLNKRQTVVVYPENSNFNIFGRS